MAALAQIVTVLAQAGDDGSGTVYVVGAAAGLLIGGLVGAIIGNMKNRVGLGIVLGALLGCVGWLIVAILPRKARY